MNEDRDLQSVFQQAWCPLFGKIPLLADRNELVDRCIDVISKARKHWDTGCFEKYRDVDASWPEPFEVPEYPEALLRASRYIYGSAEMFSNKDLMEVDGFYDYYYGISNGYGEYPNDIEELAKSLMKEIKENYFLSEAPVTEYGLLSIHAIKNAWNALEDFIVDNAGIYDEAMKKLNMAEIYFLTAETMRQKYSVAEMYFHKVRSINVIEGASNGGKKKALLNTEHIAERYNKWQRMAEVLWHKNPKLSKSRVAISIGIKTGYNPNTIRRVIVKRSS